jgi:hypothetical protein
MRVPHFWGGYLLLSQKYPSSIWFFYFHFSLEVFFIWARDLLPGAHERNPSLSSLVSSLAGFLLIYVLTLVVNA